MAQDSMTVEQRVAAAIAESLGVAETEVTSDASLTDDLGADSLDMVEVVMALEEQFDIEISDKDTEWIETVGDVVTYLKKRVAEKNNE